MQEAEHTAGTPPTYTELWTLSGDPIQGLPYDGVNDGLIHHDQQVVAVLVYISAYGIDATMTEMVVVQPQG